ncbi:MAG: chemotaxis protein CheB [Bdellovibrionota bacterium]
MTAKKNPLKIVAIGASAGGISALHKILPAFSSPSHAVVVVIHLPPEGPNLLPSLFGHECSYKVKEAESGETIEAQTIYVAPPGYHLSAEPAGTLSISNEEEINFSRPSIDVLFESVAFAYKKSAMGILLTGANHDGAQGLKTISEMGGKTLVQNLKDAEFPTMPESAMKIMKPDAIFTLEEMATFIRGLK